MAVHNRLDLIGKKFNKLTVIGESPPRGKKNLTRWLCKCDCGNTKTIDGRSLVSGNTKSCGCLKKKATYWRGCGDISGAFWVRLKRDAKLRGLSINISIEEAWELFIKQDRRCAISGAPLSFARNLNRQNDEQTASLDRIDNSKGYTIDNVKWVHKTINMMKNTLTENQLVEWCKAITQYHS